MATSSSVYGLLSGAKALCNVYIILCNVYRGCKGGVHIMGEICPRSNPDIAHMRYYLGPLKLKYK